MPITWRKEADYMEMGRFCASLLATFVNRGARKDKIPPCRGRVYHAVSSGPSWERGIAALRRVMSA